MLLLLLGGIYDIKVGNATCDMIFLPSSVKIDIGVHVELMFCFHTTFVNSTLVKYGLKL
jgi:hypothetical protein